MSYTVDFKDAAQWISNMYGRPKRPRKGDVNHDGVVTHKDAELLKAYLDGKTSNIDRNQADIRSKGKIAVDDYDVIQQGVGPVVLIVENTTNAKIVTRIFTVAGTCVQKMLLNGVNLENSEFYTTGKTYKEWGYFIDNNDGTKIFNITDISFDPGISKLEIYLVKGRTPVSSIQSVGAQSCHILEIYIPDHCDGNLLTASQPSNPYLRKIQLPNSTAIINNPIGASGAPMEELYIPDRVTPLGGAISFLNYLKKLHLPSKCTPYSLSSIWGGPKSQLKELTVPDCITDIAFSLAQYLVYTKDSPIEKLEILSKTCKALAGTSPNIYYINNLNVPYIEILSQVVFGNFRTLDYNLFPSLNMISGSYTGSISEQIYVDKIDFYDVNKWMTISSSFSNQVSGNLHFKELNLYGFIQNSLSFSTFDNVRIHGIISNGNGSNPINIKPGGTFDFTCVLPSEHHIGGVDRNQVTVDSYGRDNFINISIKNCRTLYLCSSETAVLGDKYDVYLYYYNYAINVTNFFTDCINLKGDSSRRYFNEISNVQLSNVENIANNVFRDTKIDHITLPNTLTHIGNHVFYNATINDNNFTIPDSVVEIGYDAFYNTKLAIDELVIPDNVTSIGNSAFESCSGMKSMIIGSSVTTIGSLALNVNVGSYTTDNPFKFYMKSSTPPNINGSTFSNNPAQKIYVPMDAVDTYKTATNWINIASLIEGYEVE